MYQYKNNHIQIDNNSYDFEFNIRTVIQYKEHYIVLLAIPFNRTETNNIYCLDTHAKIIWQSEDVSLKYPELKNTLPYEQMGLKDECIYASDFYGRNYKINIGNGEIEDIRIVK